MAPSPDISDKEWQDLLRDYTPFPAYTDYLYGIDTRPEALNEPGLHPMLEQQAANPASNDLQQPQLCNIIPEHSFSPTHSVISAANLNDQVQTRPFQASSPSWSLRGFDMSKFRPTNTSPSLSPQVTPTLNTSVASPSYQRLGASEEHHQRNHSQTLPPDHPHSPSPRTAMSPPQVKGASSGHASRKDCYSMEDPRAQTGASLDQPIRPLSKSLLNQPALIPKPIYPLSHSIQGSAYVDPALNNSEDITNTSNAQQIRILNMNDLFEERYSWLPWPSRMAANGDIVMACQITQDHRSDPSELSQAKAIVAKVSSWIHTQEVKNRILSEMPYIWHLLRTRQQPNHQGQMDSQVRIQKFQASLNKEENEYVQKLLQDIWVAENRGQPSLSVLNTEKATILYKSHIDAPYKWDEYDCFRRYRTRIKTLYGDPEVGVGL